jgi:hypothetical protein
MPKALKVLKAHLGEGDEVNPDAWRAALRVFEHQFGRAPEQVEEVVLPTDADGVAALSWQQLQIIAATIMSEPLETASNAKSAPSNQLDYSRRACGFPSGDPDG